MARQGEVEANLLIIIEMTWRMRIRPRIPTHAPRPGGSTHEVDANLLIIELAANDGVGFGDHSRRRAAAARARVVRCTEAGARPAEMMAVMAVCRIRIVSSFHHSRVTAAPTTEALVRQLRSARPALAIVFVEVCHGGAAAANEPLVASSS